MWQDIQYIHQGIIANRCFWKHARQAHSCSWSFGRGCTCSCLATPWCTLRTSPRSATLFRFLMFLYIQSSEYLGRAFVPQLETPFSCNKWYPAGTSLYLQNSINSEPLNIFKSFNISNHLIYLQHDNKADVDISINIFHVPMYKAYMREYMSKSSILSIWTFASEAPEKIHR